MLLFLRWSLVSKSTKVRRKIWSLDESYEKCESHLFFLNQHPNRLSSSYQVNWKTPDLPVELVERVLDYLPHRETLLHLRLVSPSLNAKASRRFGKSYFTVSSWRLSRASAGGIVHLSHCPEVVSHLTIVALTAPCGHHAVYDDIWAAKAINPAKTLRALFVFTCNDRGRGRQRLVGRGEAARCL